MAAVLKSSPVRVLVMKLPAPSYSSTTTLLTPASSAPWIPSRLMSSQTKLPNLPLCNCKISGCVLPAGSMMVVKNASDGTNGTPLAMAAFAALTRKLMSSAFTKLRKLSVTYCAGVPLIAVSEYPRSFQMAV